MFVLFISLWNLIILCPAVTDSILGTFFTLDVPAWHTHPFIWQTGYFFYNPGPPSGTARPYLFIRLAPPRWLRLSSLRNQVVPLMSSLSPQPMRDGDGAWRVFWIEPKPVDGQAATLTFGLCTGKQIICFNHSGCSYNTGNVTTQNNVTMRKR